MLRFLRLGVKFAIIVIDDDVWILIFPHFWERRYNKCSLTFLIIILLFKFIISD